MSDTNFVEDNTIPTKKPSAQSEIFIYGDVVARYALLADDSDGVVTRQIRLYEDGLFRYYRNESSCNPTYTVVPFAGLDEYIGYMFSESL